MLIIDGDDGQAPLVPDVAGQGLKVGDDQIDLRVVNEGIQPRKTFDSLRNRNQIFGDGAFVTDAIVDVSEADTVDLGDVKFFFQILQSAIERGYMDAMSLRNEMSQHLFGASRVARAFAVYAVENVGHG